MALPNIFRKLFKSNGYGPELKPEILPEIIATGSSAPRYLGDRFSDIVNLRDFGATGDGETDDSTAWAAWRTALQSGGMPYIPAGDYLLGEEIIHAPKGHFGRNTNSFVYEDDGVVLGELEAPIYVDAVGGNDANDGLSTSTPVQTFAKAIEIAETLPRQWAKIIVAGGTYNGDVSFDKINCVLEFNGSVTVNGNIDFNISTVFIDSLSYTFTCNGKIHLLFNSFVYFNCSLVVNFSDSSEDTAAFRINDAFCCIEGTVNINITSPGNADAFLPANGFVFIRGLVTISGSSIFHVLYASVRSIVEFGGGVYYTGTITSSAIVANESYIAISGNTTISNVGGFAVIYAEHSSIITISNGSTLSLAKTSQNGHIVEANSGSYVLIQSYTNVTFTASKSINAFIDIENGSVGRLADCSSVKLVGTVAWASITSQYNSFMDIYTNVNFSNASSVTGPRFQVHTCSSFRTGNAGVNKIPGSTAGSIDSNSYGVYK